MELRNELTAAAAEPGHDRRRLYGLLLDRKVFVRGPQPGAWAVTGPHSTDRALPVFLEEAGARSFWGAAAEVISMPFGLAAAEAARVGSLVIEPAGAGLLVERVDLRQLAAGETPGEFAAWMRDPARVGRPSAEVTERFRHAFVHVLVARAEQRLYLLSKSEDGTLAVPCFSAPERLAQFAQVRRLFDGGQNYAVALYRGEECLRVASGLGAYLLIDPESPWETQLDPILFPQGGRH